MCTYSSHFRPDRELFRERRLLRFAGRGPEEKAPTPVDIGEELRAMAEKLGKNPEVIAKKSAELWTALQDPSHADVRKGLGENLSALEKLCKGTLPKVPATMPDLGKRYRVLEGMKGRILLNLEMLTSHQKNPHPDAAAHAKLTEAIAQLLQEELAQYAPQSDVYEAYAKGLIDKDVIEPGKLQYLLQTKTEAPATDAPPDLQKEAEKLEQLRQKLCVATRSGEGVAAALEAYRTAFDIYDTRLKTHDVAKLGAKTGALELQDVRLLEQILSGSPLPLRADVPPAVREQFASLNTDWENLQRQVSEVQQAKSPDDAKAILLQVKAKLPDLQKRMQDYDRVCREIGGSRLKEKIGLGEFKDADFPLFLQDLGRNIPEPQAADNPDPKKLDGLRAVRTRLEAERGTLLKEIDKEMFYLVQEGKDAPKERYERLRQAIVKYLTDREMFEINSANPDRRKPNPYLMMLGTMVEIKTAMEADRLLGFDKGVPLPIKVTRELSLDKVNQLTESGQDVEKFLKERGVKNPPALADILKGLESSPQKLIAFKELLKFPIPPSLLVFYAMHISHSDNKVRASAEFVVGVMAFMKTEQAIAWSSKVLAGSRSTAVARALRVPGHPAVKMFLAMVVLYHGDEIMKTIDKWIDSLLPDTPWLDWMNDNLLSAPEWLGQQWNEGIRDLGIDSVDPYRGMDSYLSETVAGDYVHNLGDWNKRAQEAIGRDKNPVRQKLGAQQIYESRPDRERYAKEQAADLYMKVARVRELQTMINKSFTDRKLDWNVDIINVATADKGGRDNRNDRELNYYLAGSMWSENFRGSPEDAFKAKKYFEEMKEKKKKEKKDLPAEDEELLSSWEEYVSLSKTVAKKVALLRHLRYDDNDSGSTMYNREKWLGQSWASAQAPNAKLPEFVIEGVKEKIARNLLLQQAVGYQGEQTQQKYANQLVNTIKPMEGIPLSLSSFLEFTFNPSQGWATEREANLQREYLRELNILAQQAAQRISPKELQEWMTDVRALVLSHESPRIEDIREAQKMLNLRMTNKSDGGLSLPTAEWRKKMNIPESSPCFVSAMEPRVSLNGEGPADTNLFETVRASSASFKKADNFGPASVYVFQYSNGRTHSVSYTEFYCQGTDRSQWKVVTHSLQFTGYRDKEVENQSGGGYVRGSLKRFDPIIRSFDDWERSNSQATVLKQQFDAIEQRNKRRASIDVDVKDAAEDFERAAIGEILKDSIVVLGKDKRGELITLDLPALVQLAADGYVAATPAYENLSKGYYPALDKHFQAPVGPILFPTRPLPPATGSSASMSAVSAKGYVAPPPKPPKPEVVFDLWLAGELRDTTTVSKATLRQLMYCAMLNPRFPAKDLTKEDLVRLAGGNPINDLLKPDEKKEEPFLTLKEYAAKEKDRLTSWQQRDIDFIYRNAGNRSIGDAGLQKGLSSLVWPKVLNYRREKRTEIEEQLKKSGEMQSLEMTVTSAQQRCAQLSARLNAAVIPPLPERPTPAQERFIERWKALARTQTGLQTEFTMMTKALNWENGNVPLQLFTQLEVFTQKMAAWEKDVREFTPEYERPNGVLKNAQATLSAPDVDAALGEYQTENTGLRRLTKDLLRGSTHHPVLLARGLVTEGPGADADRETFAALVRQVRDMPLFTSDPSDKEAYGFDRVGWLLCEMKTDAKGNRHYLLTAAYNPPLLKNSWRPFTVKYSAVLENGATVPRFGLPTRSEGLPPIAERTLQRDGKDLQLPSVDGLAQALIQDRQDRAQFEGSRNGAVAAGRLIGAKDRPVEVQATGGAPLFGLDLGDGHVLLLREVAPGQWQHRVSKISTSGQKGGTEYTPLVDPELRRKMGEGMLKDLGGSLQGGQWMDTQGAMDNYVRDFANVQSVLDLDRDKHRGANAVMKLMTMQAETPEGRARLPSLLTSSFSRVLGPNAKEFEQKLRETMQRLDAQGVAPEERRQLIQDVQNKFFEKRYAMEKYGSPPLLTPELQALGRGLEGIQVGEKGKLMRGSMDPILPKYYMPQFYPPAGRDR